MPGLTLLMFSSPNTKAPVGSALIGLCLAVAKNKLIPPQLFLQRGASLSHGPPAVPLKASLGTLGRGPCTREAFRFSVPSLA